MDGKLIIAIIAITSALVFYTVGVFAERRARILKKWHMLVFWIGLCCDAAGTTFMTLIANSGAAESGIGVHGITGAVAIGLMKFHAAWATVTLVKKNQKQMQIFHRFSMFVWLVWLIPYFIGMFMGMEG